MPADVVSTYLPALQDSHVGVPVGQLTELAAPFKTRGLKMKQNKPLYSLLFLVAMALFMLFGCGTDAGAPSTSTATLVSIAVTPASPSLALGLTKQFSATGTYSDGTTKDLTSSVTWGSTSTGAATVSASGLATSVATGTTSISASSGNTSGSTTLTVTPAALVSIAVTPASPSTPVAVPVQLAATGTYTDATTKDITTSVAWFSPDTTIALVGNAGANGLITPFGAGTVAVSAHLSGITGSANLTVTTPPGGAGNPVVTTTHTTTTSTSTQALPVVANTPTEVEDRTYYDASVTVTVPPSHGNATVVGQVVTYTPAPGFTGTDTMTTQEVILSGSVSTIQIGDVVLGHNVNVNTDTNSNTITITVAAP